jgi:hypothetical protein
MKKRGQGDLFLGTIIEYILLAVLVALMLMKIEQETSSHRFDKMFLSKDIGLFVDALYASPNDLVVKYPQKTYDYSFIFEDSKISVYWKKEGAILAESYPFTEDTHLKFRYKTIENKPESIQTESDSGVPIIFIKTKKEVTPFPGVLVEK